MFVTLWAAPDLPRLLAWPQWTPQRTPRPHPRPRSSCWPASSRRATRDAVGRARRRRAAQGRPDRRRRGAGRRGRQARAPHPGRHPGAPALHRRRRRGPAAGRACPGRPPFVRGGTPTAPPPDGWDVRQRHEGPDRARGRRSPTWRTASPRSGWPWATARTACRRPRARRRAARPRARRARRRRGATRSRRGVPRPGERGVADPAALLGTLGLDPIGLRARTGVGPGRRLGRAAGAAGRDRAPAGARDRRRRAPGARRGRLRRPGAGLLARRGRGLPARADRRRARRRDARPGCWSSATPPPPSSSRPSRSCAPRAGCGRACWRPAARPTRRGQRQHAVASPTMLTRRDPYVNLLRGTVAGFAAGVGGADAVTVAAVRRGGRRGRSRSPGGSRATRRRC